MKEEFEDTKEVIRLRTLKKNRQHNGQQDKEEFEDTKEVIRLRKLKKNRQHNGQQTTKKRTNNDLQNIHIKLKIKGHRTSNYQTSFSD